MKKILPILLLMAFVAGCQKHAEVGTADNPIHFYFMPLKGEEKFARNAPLFKDFIERYTGLVIQPIQASNYISIIKAFSVGKADVAFLNTFGYLMARDWTRAEAHLQLLYGEEQTKVYQGEFVARGDSGIRSVNDLAGRTLVFSDPFSASGYLYPMKTLNDLKIKPFKTMIAGGHARAIEMVYNGEIDAAATYYSQPTKDGKPADARVILLSKFPDILEKVKIIGVTDPIPNGVVALRTTLPSTIKTHLVGALMEFVRTEQGKAALMDLYNVSGFALGKDKEYDKVQDLVRSMGKTSEELVEGGMSFYKTHVEPGLGN